jgi:hypothetical protein
MAAISITTRPHEALAKCHLICGLEVDFLVDLGNRRLALIEAKAPRTPTPQAADPLVRLDRAIKGYDVSPDIS